MHIPIVYLVLRNIINLIGCLIIKMSRCNSIPAGIYAQNVLNVLDLWLQKLKN